jgi:hypothetical protein
MFDPRLRGYQGPMVPYALVLGASVNDYRRVTEARILCRGVGREPILDLHHPYSEDGASYDQLLEAADLWLMVLEDAVYRLE